MSDQVLVPIQVTGASGVATLVAPFDCEVVEARVVSNQTATATITFASNAVNSAAGTLTLAGGVGVKGYKAGVAGSNTGQYRTCQAAGSSGANTGPFTGTLTSIQQADTTNNGLNVPNPVLPADVPLLTATKGQNITATSSTGTDTPVVEFILRHL